MPFLDEDWEDTLLVGAPIEHPLSIIDIASVITA